MSEFTFEVGKVKVVVSGQKNVSNMLLTCENMIRESQKTLSINDGRVNTLLKKNIKDLADEVLKERCSIRECYASLENIVAEYQRTEKEILGAALAQKNIKDAQSNPKAGSVENNKPAVPEWLKNLWKVVGKAGPVGKGISSLGKVVTDWAYGTLSSKTMATAASDIWNTAWDVGKKVKKIMSSKSSVTWKDWIGFSSGALGDIAHSNLSSMARAKHGAASVWKNTIRDFNTPGRRIKQVGGIALSGVINGFANYDEYSKKYKEGKVSKEYAIGRGVVETIGETAVDWGKNILIGSAVAGAFAAAGVAAPAVAVGVATVAVSVGADWICKKVTGRLGGEEKGVTEFVSDAIIDTGENIIKVQKNRASSLWSGLNHGYQNMRRAFA